MNVPKSSRGYVEWLEKKGSFIGELLMPQQAPTFLEEKKQEIQNTSAIIMKLADELAYLGPGNASHLGYDISMRRWRIYWNELIAEMKTVDERFPGINSSVVYVNTTWPYTEFLKSLAQRLGDMVPQLNV